jgi:hypothetical protein
MTNQISSGGFEKETTGKNDESNNDIKELKVAITL